MRLVERLHVLLETCATVLSALYLKGLASTSNPSPRATAYFAFAVRATYVVAGAFVALGMTATATRLNDFSLALDGPDALRQPGFWLFASLWLAVTPLYAVGWIVLSRQQIDPGERGRAIALACAVPLIVSATFLAPRLALLSFTVVIVLALYGQFRFLVAQGEQAAFLSRFLSPQVTELVRLRGLASVTNPQELDLSVVCIDFRGFTSYTEAIPTQAVIDLINDYHEAIGEVVARHDGMIKDYAGDGILILIGAPIGRLDHAVTALALARDALEAARVVTARWATVPHPLGVGIGVASGRVTVGAIGDVARMDYTAVGTPVNLASRLCSVADDGRILLDERVAATANGSVRPRGEVTLKGLSTACLVFEDGVG